MYNQPVGRVKLTGSRQKNDAEAIRLSRSYSAGGYAKLRKKRNKRRSIFRGVAVSLATILIVAVAAVAVYTAVINRELGTTFDRNREDFNSEGWLGYFKLPQTDEEPFWMLLLGTDDCEWMSDVPRTDTIILARVDQPNKTVALISIPRDTYVSIPNYGMNKINSAYTFGELYDNKKGVQLVIKTVSEFAGVDIAYFALINFDGFENLVDALNGVEVDVPVDIIGDHEAGNVDIYKGFQTLNGEAALTFVRSRDFPIADFQRTANQRTFLQALAKKILADPKKIAATMTEIAAMTFTNMDLQRIIKIARSLQGMQESDIRTYHVPSYTKDVMIDGYLVNCVVAYEDDWRQLISDIESGYYPPPQDGSFAGKTPDSYKPSEGYTTGLPQETTSNYVVDVKNGCGIAGSAGSVSGKLKNYGYLAGEVGDMDTIDYPTTLIVYKDVANKPAAEDIRRRLGYGILVANNGSYSFNGDILVIVGTDYRG